MSIKKVLLSLCLLLSYTVGLAHDIIPHCHHSDGMSQTSNAHSAAHDHHQDHQHSVDESVDHGHIVHDDHLDEGVVDLLICILSESSHPSSQEKHCLYVPVTAKYTNMNLQVSAKFVTVLSATRDRSDSLESLPDLELDLCTVFYRSVQLNSPHRGPPSIS